MDNTPLIPALRAETTTTTAMSCASSPLPAASRLRRFACMMYEGVLLFGVIFLASYLLDTLTQSHHALMWRHLRQFVVFLAVGVYFLLSWRKSGQTLPMKTWNIQLLDRDGKPPRLPRLLLRYLLIWPVPLLAAYMVQLASQATGYASTDLLIVFAPFALFIPTWFDPDRQFLHDRLLGTRLVGVPAAPAKSRPQALRPEKP